MRVIKCERNYSCSRDICYRHMKKYTGSTSTSDSYISGCFTILLTIAECKLTLPRLSSDMLIIEIDGRSVHKSLTEMEEKLFDKETNVL